ncbi:hypothetical protein OG500_08900 [Kitasatospora sp. NBC_01250]|uniref:hypothetical protein n=1 Tax=unclassified Kitasatospora TaxID=2633591 RepID=UPI002E0EFA2E|nr:MULTISPECIES: hypothetical protein [unclassified Kitasatospora]WSJ66216.1 hypothetical protein OG294_08875 [Kitasatospora sp. NBC_01302]
MKIVRGGQAVPAEAALRRSRRQAAIEMAVTFVLGFAPALWVRPDPDPPGILLLGLISGFHLAFFPMRCEAGTKVWVDPADPNLVTGRTLSGRRTVDLARITRIRMYKYTSRGYSPPMLMVRDHRGVRLGLSGSDGYRLVREALQRRDASLPMPRVSRSARRLIDTGSLRWGREALYGALSVLWGLACAGGVVCAAVVVAMS